MCLCFPVCLRVSLSSLSGALVSHCLLRSPGFSSLPARIAIPLARCKSSEQFVLSPVIRAPLHRAVRNAAASANGVGKRARLGGSLNLVDFVHRRVALRRRSII